MGVCIQPCCCTLPAAVSPSSLCWDISWHEDDQKSLDSPDTHLGPLPHSLCVSTLVPDTTVVGDQQHVTCIPKASFGNKSGLVKANRSPRLGQEPALQLLGALHLQENKQVSALSPAKLCGTTSQRPLVPHSPSVMPRVKLLRQLHAPLHGCTALLGPARGRSQPGSAQAPSAHQAGAQVPCPAGWGSVGAITQGAEQWAAQGCGQPALQQPGRR